MVYLYVRANNEWRVRVKCRTKTKMHNVKIGSATQFLCKNSGYEIKNYYKHIVTKAVSVLVSLDEVVMCVCALFFFSSVFMKCI